MIRSHLVGVMALTVAAAACAPAARAQGRPLTLNTPALAANVVRSYFDAFRRQDARALGAVTVGAATLRTREVLDRIQSEAERNDVGVELRVSRLSLVPRDAGDGVVPVDANFSIDVIAKKWFISKVAQVLHGRATFYVGKNLARGDITGAKIVGISLNLD